MGEVAISVAGKKTVQALQPISVVYPVAMLRNSLRTSETRPPSPAWDRTSPATARHRIGSAQGPEQQRVYDPLERYFGSALPLTVLTPSRGTLRIT
jgi:hypothetical protein